MAMLENRVPPPVLTLLLAFGMWATRAGPLAESIAPRAPWRIGLVGLVLMVAGVFGLPALRAFRRAGTTIDPVRIDRASALVTAGVYRWTRNPMYVSLLLMLVAWALWLGGLWIWAGPALLLLWLDRFQIVPEERSMRARFGEEYQRYCARVRRWL